VIADLSGLGKKPTVNLFVSYKELRQERQSAVNNDGDPLVSGRYRRRGRERLLVERMRRRAL